MPTPNQGMASAKDRTIEVPKAPTASGVLYKEGCPLPRGVPSPADYEIWGSVVSSSSGVRGEASDGNAFWSILKATEHFFLHLYADVSL